MYDLKEKNTSGALLMLPCTMEELSGIVNASVERAVESIISRYLAPVIANIDEQLLIQEEARRLFSPPICRKSFKKYVDSGKLASKLVGGRRYFRKSDILKLIEERGNGN